jgi:hypothetical protein
VEGTHGDTMQSGIGSDLYSQYTAIIETSSTSELQSAIESPLNVVLNDGVESSIFKTMVIVHL